jgi:hypothetical protein
MDDGNFKAKFGFSVVEEFVSGHEANDVLRELVQNEYDAGGEEVSIIFGSEGLTVSGKGRPIDSKGWSRLEVFLGTGRVVGGQEGDTIEGKMNESATIWRHWRLPCPIPQNTRHCFHACTTSLNP